MRVLIEMEGVPLYRIRRSMCVIRVVPRAWKRWSMHAIDITCKCKCGDNVDNALCPLRKRHSSLPLTFTFSLDFPTPETYLSHG